MSDFTERDDTLQHFPLQLQLWRAYSRVNHIDNDGHIEGGRDSGNWSAFKTQNVIQIYWLMNEYWSY